MSASKPIASGIIATGATSPVPNEAGFKTYQANGLTTSGTGSATVQIQGTVDGKNYDLIGTISLTLGTVVVSDSFLSNDRYLSIRSNVTVLTGTGASVNVAMGF